MTKKKKTRKKRATPRSLKRAMPNFPFTEKECQRPEGRPSCPRIRGCIERAAERDYTRLLDELLTKLGETNGSVLLEGSGTRDAVLTRLEESLERCSYFLPGRRWVDEIGDDAFVEEQMNSARSEVQLIIQVLARIVSDADHRDEWSDREQVYFSLGVFELRNHAFACLIKGCASEAFNICNKVGALVTLKESIGKSPSIALPKVAWPTDNNIKLLQKIMDYLEKGEIPTYDTLRGDEPQKNFSERFKLLKVKRLIPKGKDIPKNEFFREGRYVMPSAAEKSQSESEPESESESEKEIKKEKQSFAGTALDDRIQESQNHPLAPERTHQYDYSGSTERRAEDSDGYWVDHDIRLIKRRLGSVYWHLIILFDMKDLEEYGDLQLFFDRLRLFGISLDF